MTVKIVLNESSFQFKIQGVIFSSVPVCKRFICQDERCWRGLLCAFRPFLFNEKELWILKGSKLVWQLACMFSWSINGSRVSLTECEMGKLCPSPLCTFSLLYYIHSIDVAEPLLHSTVVQTKLTFTDAAVCIVGEVVAMVSFDVKFLGKLTDFPEELENFVTNSIQRCFTVGITSLRILIS